MRYDKTNVNAAPTGASILDLLVVVICAGGIVGFGLAVSRRKARAEEYFLASRASRWPAIGLARLFASNISSTARSAGLAGAAYVMGISVYDYEWSAAVVLVFYCIFLLPFVLRSRAYTMPEFLERRYDGRVRLYFAALNVFLNVFLDSAAALYCGALVCRMLLPGPPLWAFVAVLAGAAGLYTLAGGLRRRDLHGGGAGSAADRRRGDHLGRRVLLDHGRLPAHSSSLCTGSIRQCCRFDPAGRGSGRTLAQARARYPGARVLLLVYQPVHGAADAVGTGAWTTDGEVRCSRVC